jgi:DNA-binding GntR family transcriptional regulator
MLLIGMGPKPKSKGDEPEEDATKEGRVAAVKALISALKSGDAEAADEALQTHYDLCAESKHAPSDEDDEY